MRMLRGAALTAGLLLVAGCGASGLETGAGTVEKKTADAFLATVDGDWHRRVDAEPHKNLSSSARCYFVTGADGNKSLGTMACGPLRRLGTAERQVWDVVRVETTGGDQPGLEIPDEEPWQQSQLRPDNSSLWRSDDAKAADDADLLAAPPAPAATAGLTQVKDQPEKLAAKPATGKLVVPDGTVVLKGIATPDTIGSGTEVRAPASGEKFFAAVFSSGPTIDQLTGRSAFDPATVKGTPSTKWTVTVGNEQRPIEVLPAADGSAQTAEQTIIVSAPKDIAEVLLTATSGPVVQSLSLVTGKRTTDTAAAYYRTGTQVALEKSLPMRPVNQGRDFKSKFSLSLQQATLTPWDPNRGWAPTGKAWVRVALNHQLDYPFVMYTRAWSSSFLTATADGVPVPPAQGRPDDNLIALAVPAGAKRIDLTATAKLTYAANSYSNPSPRTGTAIYPTLTATATFG